MPSRISVSTGVYTNVYYILFLSTDSRSTVLGHHPASHDSGPVLVSFQFTRTLKYLLELGSVEYI